MNANGTSGQSYHPPFRCINCTAAQSQNLKKVHHTGHSISVQLNYTRKHTHARHAFAQVCRTLAGLHGPMWERYDMGRAPLLGAASLLVHTMQTAHTGHDERISYFYRRNAKANFAILRPNVGAKRSNVAPKDELWSKVRFERTGMVPFPHNTCTMPH